MDKDYIIVVERFERGGVVAYSIDEGETFHRTVREAFEHRDGVTDLLATDSSQVSSHSDAPEVIKSKRSEL